MKALEIVIDDSFSGPWTELNIMENKKENSRNSKFISLHPLKAEDAIRAALNTPPPPVEKKSKPKKNKKSR